ncbi:MAG: sigma 54-interacting transcriptional regulator [Firmicutes bacterium]|nr:sigma 54-interacting transcriptional regulator [Bacillota bacterium]
MENLKLTTIKVRDVMSPFFRTVSLHERALDLVELLLNMKLDEVLVVDTTGKLCGLVTKKQLLRDFSEGRLGEETTVAEIMLSELITTSPDEDLTQARTTMRANGIGRMPVLDAQGRIVGVITAIHVCNGFSDKLEKIGRQLQAILDTIAEAIVVVDPDGKVVYWNKSAERIYEITSDEIMGRCLSDFYPDDIALQALTSGQPVRNVYLITDKGKHLLKNAVPICQADKSVGVVCTTQDVTKAVKLMTELNLARDRITELERKTGAKQHRLEMVPSQNAAYVRTLETARRLAQTDATVLILGESGTGKELMANAIHNWSNRRNKPFIVINCAAIPENLCESELFGYATGAFTGASREGRPGKFELANGGTIFLDEVGELPLEIQAKLLRVLQEQTFYRVGGTIPVTVNVRVIAATNRDLEQMVNKGRFREDLFYRLNVFSLKMPPLRERRGDIPGLVNLFLEEFAAKYQRPVPVVGQEAMKMLMNREWRGNIRELRNTMERLVVLCDKEIVDEADVTAMIQDESPTGRFAETAPAQKLIDGNLDSLLLDQERMIIVDLLKRCNNNKAEVARLLNIPRSTLYYRMKALDIAQ